MHLLHPERFVFFSLLCSIHYSIQFFHWDFQTVNLWTSTLYPLFQDVCVCSGVEGSLGKKMIFFSLLNLIRFVYICRKCKFDGLEMKKFSVKSLFWEDWEKCQNK